MSWWGASARKGRSAHHHEEVNVIALMVVKDEVDIVGHALEAAAPWARSIQVLDNDSTDGTWDVLVDFSRRHPNIELVGRDSTPFTDAIRAPLFERSAPMMTKADWWFRLDADEIIIEDPRPVLAGVAPAYNVVHGSFFKYYFTERDHDAYAVAPEAWLRRTVPDRLRYYRNDWCEARFHRFVKGARVNDTGWPRGRHVVAPELVPILHYEFRSPDQIDRRLEARRRIPNLWPDLDRTWDIFGSTESCDGKSWQAKIAKSSMLDYDDGGSMRRARPELLPHRHDQGWWARGGPPWLVGLANQFTGEAHRAG